MVTCHMEEDELCALFTAELDIEEKFFEIMPYDSNDPDFDWHKYQTASEDSEDEGRSPNAFPNGVSARGVSIEDCKTGEKRRKSRKCEKRRRKKHQTPPTPQRKVTVMSSKGKAADISLTDTKFKMPDTFGISITPRKMGRHSDPSRNVYSNCVTPTSDSDEDARQALQKHRRLISCKSSPSIVPKKECADDSSTTYPLNIYPNNWERVEKPSLNSTYPPYTAPLCASTPAVSLSNHNDEYWTPPKRTRWSSSYSSSSTATSVEFRNPALTNTMPCYKNYQLLGDSQFVRFSEQLLSFKRYVTYTENRTRRIGYCVSGQKIGDLLQRLRNSEYKLANHVIMLIGTNDLVYDSKLSVMCDNFDSILNILKNNGVLKIVTLTVPPVPKLTKNSEYWDKLRRFNNFVMTRTEEGRIFAVDLASLYVSYDNKPNLLYFEKSFDKPTKIDLVHLNRAGFKLLKAVLDINYFDKYQFDTR